MSDPTTDAVTTTAGAGITPGTASGTGTQPGTTAADERKFTQDEVNRLLAEERRKADEKRKADEARAKAQAAEAAAKESGEWKTLAETVTHERDRLTQEREQVAAERDALAAELESEIKARLKALPDELRDLVPSDASPAQRFAALRKVEAAARKLGTATAATAGTPTGPRGAGAQAVATPNPADLIAQKRARIGGL